MQLPRILVEHVALHGFRDVFGVHQVRLAESVGQVEPHLRLDHHGVLRGTVLGIALDIGNDLGHAERHRLERTEPEPLALRAGHARIRAIIQHIHVLILVTGILRGHHQPIAEHLHRAAVQLDFTGKDVE